MELFDKYDHVILCERHHQEMTQDDMIFDLITDKRFVDKVGVVFTEIGCAESRKAWIMGCLLIFYLQFGTL